MQIRDAKSYDLDRCAELCKTPELLTAEGDPISAGYLGNHIDNDSVFLVASEHDEIYGFILGESMKGGLVFLHFLVVDPNKRGNGVGSRLMDTFFSQCKQNGREVIILYAPTLNPGTLNFYQKHGFDKGKEHMAFSKELK